MRIKILLRILTVFTTALFFTSVLWAEKKPNIIIAIADDWGWPHASAYGNHGLKTPVFDQVAASGARFNHAYVSSPSCTPSRGSVLSGQWHWRLKENGNLWSTIRKEIPLYTDLLGQAGYHVGHIRKGWGPGNFKAGGRKSDPAGKKFSNFDEFLKSRQEGQPFCFWFGSSDPHRPYKENLGQQNGIDPLKVHLFKCFPDHSKVRGDVADYFFEVQRFDRELGRLIKKLKAINEYENTMIIITGDHGMPFPRCKGNLYDSGVRVPLAICWGNKIQMGTVSNDFVSLIDLAPTILNAAGVPIPEEMWGIDLLTTLKGDAQRDSIIFGRERHTPAQKFPSLEGYPSRAIRTKDFLYIINFKPDLWPAGVPSGSTRGPEYSDCDGGPTKSFIIKNKKLACHSILKTYLHFGITPFLLS